VLHHQERLFFLPQARELRQVLLALVVGLGGMPHLFRADRRHAVCFAVPVGFFQVQERLEGVFVLIR